MFQSFILVLALCADTFGAGLAYGTNRIRVGFGKVLFLNGICSVCLGLAMTAGFFAAERLSGINLRTLCGGSLIFMGLFRLTDFSLRRWIPDALGEWTQFLLFSFRYSCAYTDLE